MNMLKYSLNTYLHPRLFSLQNFNLNLYSIPPLLKVPMFKASTRWSMLIFFICVNRPLHTYSHLLIWQLPKLQPWNSSQTIDNLSSGQQTKGGIIVQNRSEYQLESTRLLSDNSTYQKLTSDPLPNFSKEAHNLINRAATKGLITAPQLAFLKQAFYKWPYFYHLPKIHKDLVNPPGRPIVAAMESVMSYFSICIDHFLQSLVQNFPPHIKESIQLLNLLQQYCWEPLYCWLSLDVVSLYTSIPHNIGLQAVQYYLNEDPLLNPRYISSWKFWNIALHTTILNLMVTFTSRPRAQLWGKFCPQLCKSYYGVLGTSSHLAE